jgi:hypothetical protein
MWTIDLGPREFVDSEIEEKGSKKLVKVSKHRLPKGVGHGHSLWSHQGGEPSMES